ncbi:MAG: hypothetical protein NC177_18370 [Ruminococcus flavefaciens]|nr:hypothetical protein [Ruminococcus flavefaciens]
MNETNYKYIRQLYLDYIKTDEYNNHPLTTKADQNGGESVNKAIEILSSGTDEGRIDATDIMLSSASYFEETGFILGFAYAMHFISETNQVKGDILK